MEVHIFKKCKETQGQSFYDCMLKTKPLILWVNYNSIKSCCSQERPFLDEFLLSSCRWILTQNLYWGFSKTNYAGTSSISDFESENGLTCFCNFSVLVSNSRWWSTMRLLKLQYLLNDMFLHQKFCTLASHILFRPLKYHLDSKIL